MTYTFYAWFEDNLQNYSWYLFFYYGNARYFESKCLSLIKCFALD